MDRGSSRTFSTDNQATKRGRSKQTPSCFTIITRGNVIGGAEPIQENSEFVLESSPLMLSSFLLFYRENFCFSLLIWVKWIRLIWNVSLTPTISVGVNVGSRSLWNMFTPPYPGTPWSRNQALGKEVFVPSFSLVFIFSFSNAAGCEVIILTYPGCWVSKVNYTLPIPRLLQAVCGDVFNTMIPA